MWIFAVQILWALIDKSVLNGTYCVDSTWKQIWEGSSWNPPGRFKMKPLSSIHRGFVLPRMSCGITEWKKKQKCLWNAQFNWHVGCYQMQVEEMVHKHDFWVFIFFWIWVWFFRDWDHGFMGPKQSQNLWWNFLFLFSCGKQWEPCHKEVTKLGTN